MTELDYEHDIRIDENALDIEWLEQASLAYNYGKHYAECKRRFFEAEERVKIIRSELTKATNEDPEGTCGKAKPIAADVEAYYRMHPSHIKAKNEWIQAQYEMDMAEVAKNEIGFTRKTALENLAKLLGMNYFAGPRTPRNLHEERTKNIPVEIKLERTK